MRTMLRVFWTHCTLPDSNGSHYKRNKTHTDFPPDVTPEAACEELLHKYGRSTDSSLWDKELGVWITPPQYAEINSHTMVDVDREKVTIGPEERAIEQPLFDGITLKACLQDSPDLKSKRFKQRNRK